MPRIKFILSILTISVLISCTKTRKEVNKIEIDSFPQVYPSEIIRFDKTDTLFFSYLGVHSFLKDDRGIILSVYKPEHLIKIDESGKTLLAKTSFGRGPGELLEIGEPVEDEEGNIHIYDRNKSAVLIFDSNLNLVNEFQIASNNSLYVKKLYPLEGNNYLVQMTSIKWIIDPNEKKYLIFSFYNADEKEYGETVMFEGRQYAQSKNPSPPAPTNPFAEYLGGDRAISFSSKQLYEFSIGRESLFLFNTGSNKIAEVDMNFDTLKVIDIDLPTEGISAVERDSISKNINDQEIRNDLISRLPEFKTPVEHMIIDHKNRFWLKSNLRGNYEKWFVLNEKGEIRKVVNLPKGSFITHISGKNIGIRLDDSTFGLYTNPN